MKNIQIKFKSSKSICKVINVDGKSVQEILVIKKGIEIRIDPNRYYVDLNFNLF